MTDPFDLARFVTAVNLRRLVAAAVIVIPSNGPVRMSSSIRTTVNNPELRAEALGFGESVVMGVASIGPAYSLAATAAVLIGSVGVLAPVSLLYCGLIMFCIVFAFRHLNRMEANAGASYSWVTAIFSPAIGFFAGWTVVASSALFMVSGTLPAAAATLKLFEPSLLDNQTAVTLIAAGWVVIIGAIVA